MYGHGADEPLHKEFAREGEDDGVESDEDEVATSFAILHEAVGGGPERIGEEDRGM